VVYILLSYGDAPVGRPQERM